MRAVSEVRALLCTSAAVLALVWFGQAAMAQEEPAEEPAVVTVEEGGDGMDIYIGPAEGGETVIDTEVVTDESVCGGCEMWTTVEPAVDGEEYAIEDETVLVDGEEIFLQDDGGVVDGGEIKTEDGSEVADAGGEAVDGEFVTTCDGCEVQNIAGQPPVFMAGGPEVQRDNAGGGAPAIPGSGNGSDTVVSRSSGNACDAGPLSTMWICTVQGDSWRN